MNKPDTESDSKCFIFIKQKHQRDSNELLDQADNNEPARSRRIHQVDTVKWITPSITSLAEGIAKHTNILMDQVLKMNQELKDQQFRQQGEETLKKFELESSRIRRLSSEMKSTILLATDILNKLNENNALSSQIFNSQNKTYNIQDKEIKDLLCKLAEILPYQLVGKCFNVCPRNICRWLQKGTIRKKGGGKKILDSQMEQELKRKYDEEVANHGFVSNKKLRELALQCSTKDDFKASRSWLARFKRDNLIIIRPKRKRNPQSTLPSTNNWNSYY